MMLYCKHMDILVKIVKIRAGDFSHAQTITTTLVSFI